MKFERWTIAYRKREAGKSILDDLNRSFKIIPNTWRYWCADPHLFDYEGHTYVFAELYDKVLRRGVIGCCEIIEKTTTPWKVVLKMPYHLSYPHVFFHESDIYMIPESYVAKEIAIFKANKFPYDWEKIAVLKNDYIAVDSTLFTHNNHTWMITLQFKDNAEFLQFFSLSHKEWIREEVCV